MECIVWLIYMYFDSSQQVHIKDFPPKTFTKKTNECIIFGILEC